MKACIIANGEGIDSEVLRQLCNESDVVICADGGGELLKEAGLKPDYLMGDFDSIHQQTYHYFEQQRTKILQFPSDKDFTDSELCVDKALELGADEICMVSGIGSRLDHSLGNVLLLSKIMDHGVKGWIFARSCSIYLCGSHSSITICGEIGQTLSVLPILGDVTGVTLKGFKFPLQHATVKVGQTVGISNVIAEAKCSIEIAEGRLLVIHNHYIE